MDRVKVIISLLLAAVAVAALASDKPGYVAPPIVVPPPTPDDFRDEAIRNQATKWGIDPNVMLLVSHAENFSGIRDAWSYNHCCVGIAQVHVKIWLGVFDKECGGSDLLTYDTNACYGVLILKTALKECKQDIECALYKYRGAADTAYVTKILAEVE